MNMIPIEARALWSTRAVTRVGVGGGERRSKWRERGRGTRSASRRLGLDGELCKGEETGMSHGPARFEEGGRTARGEVDVLLVLSLGDGRLLTLQVTMGASVRVVCELTGRSKGWTDLGQAATNGAGLLVAEV